MKKTLLLTLPLLCAQLASAQSNIPNSISYQGRISDAAGVLIGDAAPVNREVTLRIYGSPTGNDIVYAEKQTVTISKGQFSLLLGTGLQVGSEPRPALTDALTGSERFLGVTVDDGTPTADPEVSPRQQMVSSAFTLRARRAETSASTDFATVAASAQHVQAAPNDTSNFNWINAANMTVNGHSKITGNNILEFGVGIQKGNAGWIGYQSAGSSGLEIVGAGTSDAERRVTMWAEAGTEFKGAINFGQRLGQHINLWGDTFGLGIEPSTLFSRSSDIFKWYRGGNAGGGGSLAAYLDGNGLTVNAGSLSVPNGRIYGALDRGGHGVFAGSWGDGHSFGSQDWTTFSRTAKNFAWYLGGSFNSAELNAGGGTKLAQLDGNGLNVGGGLWAQGEISSGGNMFCNRELTVGGDRIRLGASRLDRQPDAGTIGYGLYGFNGLSIVGGGTTADTFQQANIQNAGLNNRSVKFWAEGGSYFTGTVYAEAANVMVLGPYRYYNLSTQNFAAGTTSRVSFFGSDRVVGSEFNATSDARIKKIKGQSDSAKDLASLMNVKITDYTKVDDMAAKPREYKKVIAQELETVFPQAVTKMPGTVPDVFRKFTADAGFIAVKEPLAHPVKKGDVLKIYLEKPETAAATKPAKKETAKTETPKTAERNDGSKNDEVVTEVTEVTKDGFRVKEKLNGNVFIYGRKVEDMRVVDYEAIAMLNVSATQELNRTIEKQAAALQKLQEENAALEKRLTDNKAEDQLQESRLVALEKALRVAAPAPPTEKKTAAKTTTATAIGSRR